MTPPPGWYRDPAYPLVERWWDGTAWTDHRRGPEAPQVPLAPPRPVGGGSGRAKAVALVTAGVVLVTSIVTGAFVLGREGGGGTAATRTTPPTAPAQTTGSPADPSSGDPSVVVDELNGITLPLFDGWVRAQDVAEDDVMMTTPGTYDCPGDPGLCRRRAGRLAHRHRERREVPEGPRRAGHRGRREQRVRPRSPRQPALPRRHVPPAAAGEPGRRRGQRRIPRALAGEDGGGTRRLRRIAGVPLRRGLTGPRHRPLRVRRGCGRAAAHRHGPDHRGNPAGERAVSPATGRCGPLPGTSGRSPSPCRPRPGAARRTARTAPRPSRAGTTPCRR